MLILFKLRQIFHSLTVSQEFFSFFEQ